MGKMIDAITAHRSAWQAFQDAPYDPEGTPGYDLASRAELDMHEAIDVLLQTIPATPDDLIELKDHLDWYIAEEADGPGVIIDIVRSLHAAITLAMSIGWQDGFLTCGEHYEAKGASERTQALAVTS